MKMNVAVTAGLAALALCAPAHAQEMRPGLWEFTTNVSLPGKKAGTQVRRHQQCITPAEVKDKSAFRSQLDPKLGCTMSDFRQDGSRFSYRVACKGQLSMTGRVDGNVLPDAMSMNMEMDMSAMKGAGTVKQSMTARRLGECTT